MWRKRRGGFQFYQTALLFSLYLGWKHYFQLQIKPKSGYQQPVMQKKAGRQNMVKKAMKKKILQTVWKVKKGRSPE